MSQTCRLLPVMAASKCTADEICSRRFLETLGSPTCCDAQRGISYHAVVGCNPGVEAAHEAARVHNPARRRGGGLATRRASTAASSANRCFGRDRQRFAKPVLVGGMPRPLDHDGGPILGFA